MYSIGDQPTNLCPSTYWLSDSVLRSCMHLWIENAWWVVTILHSHSKNSIWNCLVVMPGFTPVSNSSKSSPAVFLPGLWAQCLGAQCLMIVMPLLGVGFKTSFMINHLADHLHKILTPKPTQLSICSLQCFWQSDLSKLTQTVPTWTCQDIILRAICHSRRYCLPKF